MVGTSLHRRVGRRALTCLALIAIAAAVAGCQTPPPGPAPEPPTISSAIVTPDPAVAGEMITATVVVSTPQPLTNLSLTLIEPHGAVLPNTFGSDLCGSEGSVGIWLGPGATGEFSVSCRLPAYVPNGTWQARIGVSTFNHTTGSYGKWVTVPIEVVGGSDDIDAPVVTTLSAVPATVSGGDAFEARFRVEDDHLLPGTTAYPYGFVMLTPDQLNVAGTFPCTDRTTTQVDPTVIESTATCRVPEGLPPGVYTSYMVIKDVLGFTTRLDFATTVD